MNERIKKLDKQAVDHALSVCDANGVYQGKEYLSVVKEKFAQLIVQECLAQVARVDDMLEDDPAQTAAVAWVASSIADHFGVEE